MAFPTFYCSFCGSGFSGKDGRLVRDACEDLPTPAHRFEVGDHLSRKSGGKDLVIILGKFYKRKRDGTNAFHAPWYRIMEKDMEGERPESELIEQFHPNPKLTVVRKDPD